MYDGTQYQLMAEYNRWMNEKIYTICLGIPDEKRKEDLGAFFKSIHGTLDHILWGNRALWGRLIQKPIEVTVIGQILYTDFDELWAEQQKLDDELVQWTHTLDPEWLQSSLKYTSFVDGKRREIPHWVMVTHLFNHQTHHRGQVTTLMKQLGYDPGITDLPWTPALNAVVD
ncbi:DinB family protein [Chloroflexi bacterium TSY]|nr:DinB family protein [Chloroflexi bacterium TSY]